MTDREAIDVLFNEWKCIDRNDGIHCDRKCESCDLVMDVGIIREAFNMAISALQAQDVPGTNVGDMISRQAAIDALSVGKELLSRVLDDMDVVGADREKYSWGLGLIEANIKDIEELPSAQPEIIRCKDCKWWSNDDYRECSNPNYDDGYVTPAGFYCGYAERRTDEQN